MYSIQMTLSLLSGIFLHDPVSFVALVRPDLFTYKKGVVRVETQGICAGHTLLDQGLKKYVQTLKNILFLEKFNLGFLFLHFSLILLLLIWHRWNSSNPWTEYSPVSVAWTVNVKGVLDYIRKLLMKPWNHGICIPLPESC